MEVVLMIIVSIVTAVAIVIYPKKDTFVAKLKLKGDYKSFELEICTKQKNCPPEKDDSSNVDK